MGWRALGQAPAPQLERPPGAKGPGQGRGSRLELGCRAAEQQRGRGQGAGAGGARLRGCRDAADAHHRRQLAVRAVALQLQGRKKGPGGDGGGKLCDMHMFCVCGGLRGSARPQGVLWCGEVVWVGGSGGGV